MKEIPGYERLYSINDQGHVWRHEKLTNRKHSAGWLKASIDSDGYPFVALFKDGVRKYHKVHRLVAAAFLDYDPKGPLWVLHKNDVRNDPRACNLFLGTPKDNQQDCIKKGRKVVHPGEKNSMAKLTESQAQVILDAEGTHESIAERFSITQCQVSRIKNGRRWPHLKPKFPKVGGAS